MGLGHAHGGQCTHRVEPARGQLECLSQRVHTGEHEHDAPRVLHDGAADLQPATANGGTGGACQSGACERMAFERLHQGVGECGQEPPKRVGLEALATRARTEHIPLRLLDPILGLTALTVESVVERLIAVVAVMTRQEMADDEARVDALGTVFEPGHHAPGDIPALGGVDELADLSLLLAALLIGLFHRAFDEFDLTL